MTKQELLDGIAALQRECNEKQRALRKQYAAEHNPVKVGDVVTDHYHTIRVESISLYGSPVSYCCYTGTELTKQREPKKRQPPKPNPVFQINIKEINGQPYHYEV